MSASIRTAATPWTLGPSVIAAPPLTWNGGGSRQTPRRTLSRKMPGARGTAVPRRSTQAPGSLGPAGGVGAGVAEPAGAQAAPHAELGLGRGRQHDRDRAVPAVLEVVGAALEVR